MQGMDYCKAREAMPVQVIGSVGDIANDGGKNGHQFAHHRNSHYGPGKPVLVVDKARLFPAAIRLLPLLASCVNHEAEQNSAGDETEQSVESPIHGNTQCALLEWDHTQHDLESVLENVNLCSTC